jgi:sialate O-acetylesterase
MILFFLAGTLVPCAFGTVVLAPILSDHAVLLKSDKVPVWGTAAPGEAVSVTLDHASATATADAAGKWKAELNLNAEGPGPFDLVVQGTNKLVASDVVVGEVWVCSGQSNMDFTLAGAATAKEEIAASANPQLRLFTVGKNYGPTPMDTCNGQWMVAGPTTSGAFSAVGYFYGKALQRELKVPVGMISSAWGGTPYQTWISLEGTEPNPEIKAQIVQSRQATMAYPDQLKSFVANLQAWEKKYDRTDKVVSVPADYTAPGISTADWKPVTLPGLLSKSGLPDAGETWLRREVDISPEQAGNAYLVSLGRIHDFDEVYWNGQMVGNNMPDAPITGLYQAVRMCTVPGNLITAGKGILTVRVSSPNGGAAIDGPVTMTAPNSLSGTWLAKNVFALPPPSDEARASFPVQPVQPSDPEKTGTWLFNGMISPLTNFAIRGAIWYQGETNVGDPLYHIGFPLLIQDWRHHWGRGDFPFYFCQLPNFLGKSPTPGESKWAEMREQQSAALALPNTGEAVLIDVGEEGNIHPRDKQTPGERLALVALNKTYGHTNESSGPTFDSLLVVGSDIHLSFQHTTGGLVAKPLPSTYQPRSDLPAQAPLVPPSPGSEVQGFAICGDDHHWKWADAKIESDSVILSTDGLSHPVAIRYAWADNPTCNLYNGAGLPAAPFQANIDGSK